MIKIKISWYFLLLLFLTSSILAKYFSDIILNDNSGSSSSIEKKAQEISALCKNSDRKDQCYGDAFYKITKQKDSNYSVEVLSELQRINPKDVNGCHFMAHRISQSEVEKDPENWKDALLTVSPSACTGGFLHGVIEAHMATDSEFSINEKAFQQICDEVYEKHKTFSAWRGCVHNMGHLMLVEKNGNLANAVESCSEIKEERTQYECLSGAFMERVTGENLLAHGIISRTRGWDEEFTEETEEVCVKYTATSARACWKVISYLYFAVSNHDPKGLYEKCQKAPEEQMRDECFIYGAGNLVNTTRFDQDNLYDVCHQFTENHHLFAPCMNQIVGSLLTSSANNIDKTINLCDKTYKPYSSQCYNKIIDTLNKNNAPDELVHKTCIKAGMNTTHKYCKT